MIRAALRLALAAFVLSLPVSAAKADWAKAQAALQAGKTGDAFRELKPLAEDGDKDAQYMIAYLLSTGNGVKLDLEEAYKWYTIAVARGHTQANAARSYVRRKLNFAAAAEAERKARDWLQEFAVKEARRRAEEKREEVLERQRLEEEAKAAAKAAGQDAQDASEPSAPAKE